MAPSVHTSRFTVLLADQDDSWQQTIRSLLLPQGVETVVVRTGREAWSQIESGNVHVAVLDQSMPQLGGLQIVRRMRQLESAPPTILLTGQYSQQLLHEALGMRVFSVLCKPVDFNVLLDTLARVMRRHYEGRWPT
jgi:DNA-binding response OmpR family regulator